MATKIIDLNLEYPEFAPVCPEFGSCSSSKFKVKYFFIVQNAPSTVDVEMRIMRGDGEEYYKTFKNKFGTFNIEGEFDVSRPYDDYGTGTYFEVEIQVYGTGGQRCDQGASPNCKAVYHTDFVVQNSEPDAPDDDVIFGNQYLEVYNVEAPINGVVGEQVTVMGDIKIKDLDDSTYAQKLIVRVSDKEGNILAEKVVDNAIYSNTINLPKYYQDVAMQITLTEDCSNLQFQAELLKYTAGDWYSTDTDSANTQIQIESIYGDDGFPIIPIIPIIPIYPIYPDDTIEQKKEIPWALIVLGAGGLILLLALMTKKKDDGQSQQPTQSSNQIV